MQLKIRHWDQIRVMPDMVISIIANHWISNSISIWLVMWPFPVKVYDGSVAFSIYFSKIVNREVDLWGSLYSQGTKWTGKDHSSLQCSTFPKTKNANKIPMK